MTSLLALLLSLPGFAQGLRKAPSAEVGVLLLAHGGDASWDNEIEKIQRQLSKDYSVETALGMADSPVLQKAVDRLEARGVKRIVAVPLFISSYSEVMDQTRYLFGLRDQPSKILIEASHGMLGMPRMMDKVKLKVPLKMAPGLDASPLVTEILADRIRAMSRDPRGETVLLVAHGPVAEAYNQKWLEMMGVHAARLKREFGFKAVEAATLRDDAPSEVRSRAVQGLRDAVRRLEREGRVLVVPLLIAKGGIEQKIPKELEGTFFAWKGDTLAPHPNLAKWVLQTVGKAGESAPSRQPRPARPARKTADDSLEEPAP